MQIAHPLNNLTKKDQAFEWKNHNRQRLTHSNKDSPPPLAFPDIDKQFCLETDASDFATSAVLSILKDDKWHPITYSSHSMSPEERNYPIADKEMLSFI